MNKPVESSGNEMTGAYWDGVAGDYDRCVLSVFDRDTEGVVSAQIVAAARLLPPGARAADLGCGVGKFTPTLAGCFASVEACDRSAGCLAAAQAACRGHENIRFRQLDFALDPAPFDPVDFALCVNVLIMPSLDERLRAWRFVVNQVAGGGLLAMVVPSLEWALYADFRRVEWGLRDGLTCAEAVARGLGAVPSAPDLSLGVKPIERMPTKHYLQEELEFMLADRGFEMISTRRVEYRWSTFFPELPEEPGGSSPWDWLVVARRRE